MPFPQTAAPLQHALAARGYEEPTPVQAAVLAEGTQGRDLLVSAQTGSGKTVAFGLALADTLLGGEVRFGRAGAPLALVIAPTRELAMQVQTELAWLYAEAGARIVSCIGGTDARSEARALAAGAHIVVGTPGRLCDHLNRKNLNLSSLRAAVLDEADEMLDLGFREELEMLLDASPKERRTLLFSATIAREIASLARRYQNDAVRIDTASGAKQHADITYQAVVTTSQDMGKSIVNVLRYYEDEMAMLFCGTREMVRQVQSALMERGFASVAISGEMGQNERSRAIESLRSGQARVCVATDVAARGIDIPTLGLVIHGNLPTDPANFLHRSGRTGRAGRKGTCVVMVPVNQRGRAQRLLAGAKITAEWTPVPTADMIRERDADRLLTASVLTTEKPVNPALLTKLTEAHSKEELAAALVRLYQERMPAVEDLRPLSVENPRPLREERNARIPGEPGSYAREGGQRERAPRMEGNGEWYRLSVGRRDKADPKWLVPLICRLGGVKKSDIGSIRIADEHTEFEISSEMASRFSACIQATEADEAKIEAIGAPTTPEYRGGAGRPARAPREQGDRPRRDGPSPKRSFGGANRPPRSAAGSTRKRRD